MTDDAYTRRFVYGRSIDGDTIADVTVDVGFHMQATHIQFRLARINCPEMHKPTLDAGRAAKAYTEAWLLEHGPHGGLFCTTTKTDDFGRYLSEIDCGQSHNLSDALLESGNAVPYRAT